MPRDPRWYQIAVLSGLLMYGMSFLDFDVTPGRAALLLSVALATQWALGRVAGLPSYDPRSALISGLSLCLLLRTNSRSGAGLAGVRRDREQVRAPRAAASTSSTPRTSALVLAARLGAPVWVSPGQWGSVAFFAFLDGAASARLVVHRAARSDVTLGVPRRVRRAAVRPRAWLGAAAGDPAPPAPERSAAAVRVLHDLGPQDHARLARRARRCSPRSSRSAPASSSSCCSARTACCGRSPSSRRSCR